MGLLNPHSGSWAGLPDFGITEAVGGLLGSQRTAQGGSNVFSTPGASSSWTPSSNSQVLGASTQSSPYGPNLPSSPSPSKNPQTSGQPGLLSSGGGTSTMSSGSGIANDYSQLAQDNYTQQVDEIKSLSDAELAGLESDMNNAGLSRQNLLFSIDNQSTQLTAQRDQQVQDAQDRAVQEIDSGSQTARNAQQKIRNSLRALGILASSAAGELLSQPITEFTKQKSQINQALTKRVDEINNLYTTELGKLTQAKNQVELEYSRIISQIKSDYRFTEAERNSSLQAARNALQEQLLSIRSQLNQTQDAVMSEVGNLQEWAASINDQAITQPYNNLTQQQSQSTQQASIYDPNQDKELNNFLGI